MRSGSDAASSRSWAFRQTLHLLRPDDLAEFVVAARSLERWHSPVWLRYFKMSEAGVAQVIDTIGAVMSDRPMTRVEVVDAVVSGSKAPPAAGHADRLGHVPRRRHSAVG